METIATALLFPMYINNVKIPTCALCSQLAGLPSLPGVKQKLSGCRAIQVDIRLPDSVEALKLFVLTFN